jgi:hypothetical protein
MIIKPSRPPGRSRFVGLLRRRAPPVGKRHGATSIVQLIASASVSIVSLVTVMVLTGLIDWRGEASHDVDLEVHLVSSSDAEALKALSDHSAFVRFELISHPVAFAFLEADLPSFPLQKRSDKALGVAIYKALSREIDLVATLWTDPACTVPFERPNTGKNLKFTLLALHQEFVDGDAIKKMKTSGGNLNLYEMTMDGFGAGQQQFAARLFSRNDLNAASGFAKLKWSQAFSVSADFNKLCRPRTSARLPSRFLQVKAVAKERSGEAASETWVNGYPVANATGDTFDSHQDMGGSANVGLLVTATDPDANELLNVLLFALAAIFGSAVSKVYESAIVLFHPAS